MKIHIKSYNNGIWEANKNGPTMVTYDVDGITMPKP